MSNIARFAAYAAAFEKSYESDDWTGVEAFFSEDAVYEAGIDLVHGGRAEGRAAILAYFEAVLNAFDRCFESRELALVEGPTEVGDGVRIRGTATYRASGVPPLVLELVEIVTFRDGLIVHLEDIYEDAMATEAATYIEDYRDKLGFEAT